MIGSWIVRYYRNRGYLIGEMENLVHLEAKIVETKTQIVIEMTQQAGFSMCAQRATAMVKSWWLADPVVQIRCNGCSAMRLRLRVRKGIWTSVLLNAYQRRLTFN